MAQNAPAGPPASPPAVPAPTPGPDKAAVEAIREAGLKPATAPSSDATPAPEPAPPPPAPAPAPQASGTSGENLPDPPALPASLTGGPPEEGPPAGMSELVVINLIRKLVEKGQLTEKEAQEMVLQAEAEAEAARSQAKAAMKRDAAKQDESLLIPYVPESVRTQMRDEIKQEVLAEMRLPVPGSGKNNGYMPGITVEDKEGLFGDVRIRFEMLNYDDNNDNSGSFPNFHAINTGAPFDTAGNVFSPQYNVDQDRERYRLRFRIGGDYELSDDWKAGFRIATGENSSPVTTNQSFGLANQAAGGNFSKYAIWLDRAFMRWDHEWDDGSTFTFTGGRFENPFMVTEIMFDEDVNMDGIAGKWKPNISDKVKPFITAGAFPVFNTDLNFSNIQPAKFSSTDKYLFAAQLGSDFKLAKDLTVKLAAGYYAFDGVEGRLSTPYTPITAQDAGDTDNTRPSFAQRGNTYRPLRQIIPDATNNFGTINQWQYYGLATEHRPLALSARVDWDRYEPVRVTGYAEYIKNTAYDSYTLNTYGVNNRGPSGAGGAPGSFEGSDYAWIAGIKVGKPALDQRGDWQALFNYRWVGSDAAIDAFTDSEFGGGGTNFKGWTVAAQWALSKHAAFGLSWLSSDAIAGPPLKSDAFQVDLKIKF